MIAAATSSNNSDGLGESPDLSLRMWYDSGSGLVSFPTTTNRVFGLKVSRDYEQPAMCTFRVRVAQHSVPIPFRSFVVVADPNYGGAETPVFEGWVHSVSPVGNREVEYLCYDQTRRATDEIHIRNAPSYTSTALPRVVYNCRIDADPDYSHSILLDGTVGEIIADVLEQPYAELVALKAVPPLGNVYVQAQLDALDYKPQDKVVFESEQLRSGLDRMTDLYPQYRWLMRPGVANRNWELIDVTASSATTLTLNSFSTKKVIALQLDRSLENRWTAVRIYGPAGATNATATQAASGLTKQWTVQEETFLTTLGPASSAAHVGAKWQIADSTKRHLLRLLPEEVLVPTAGMQTSTGGNGVVGLSFARTRRPTLVATWDSGTTWEPVQDFTLDYQRGIVQAPYAVVKYNGSTWDMPDDVKLYFAYYGDPLAVRYPTSGFEGSAYDDYGIEAQKEIYDEMLAIGFEYGNPVTSVARQAEFTKLATSWLKAHKDTVYSGVATLLGIDYDFFHLNKKIHFTAVDNDGNSVTTGWESAGAILTGVEYDYSVPGGTTQLTFSGDLADYSETNIDALKALQGIRAMEQRAITTQRIVTGFNPRTKQTTLQATTDTLFFYSPVEEIIERTVN